MQALVDWLYLFFIGLRGPRIFKTRHQDKDESSSVVIRLSNGIEIMITFQIVRFCYLYYPRRLFRKHSKLYLVRGNTDANAPGEIREMLIAEYYIPRLAPWFVSDELHHKLLGEAFIDLITNRYKNNMCTHSRGDFSS